MIAIAASAAGAPGAIRRLRGASDADVNQPLSGCANTRGTSTPKVSMLRTCASAIQVVPELAEGAAHTTVFQRTPAWVIPRSDRAFSALERAAFRRLPGRMRLERWRLYLQMQQRHRHPLQVPASPRKQPLSLWQQHLHLHLHLRQAWVWPTASSCFPTTTIFTGR